MRQNLVYKKIIFVSMAALFVLACGAALGATAVPALTNTSAPAATKTPRATSTPRPTATEVPPTSTAVPVGVPASNAAYEVTVIKVRKLESVYLSETHYWAAKPGYQFVELGIRIKNLQHDREVSVPWNNVYIIEQDGTYYPGWGAFKAVESGIEINPSSLVFEEIEDPGKEVTFKNDAFLRLIFTVTLYDKTVILFGFDDSPLTEIVVQ
jgi:hypothetical protein